MLLEVSNFPFQYFNECDQPSSSAEPDYWSQVLTMVGTEYQMLLGNGQWVARGVQSETPQKALKAEIKNEVMQELKRMDVKPSGVTQTGAAKNSINPNIICNKCKEKGHIARNCPKKDAPKQEGVKEQAKTPNPYKVKLKEGEPEVKKINNVKCSWCKQCIQWTSGDKRHSTIQHMSMNELQGRGMPSSTPAGNLATGSFRGGLTMTHFHGAAGHVQLSFAC